MPFVFPERHEAAQLAGGNHRDGGPGQVLQIADEPPRSQFPVPDFRTEPAHGPGGPGGLFVGLAGGEELPGGPFGGEDGIEFRPSRGGEERRHVVLQPLPVLVAQRGQLGVLFAVALMGAPEEDPAAHHPHAGAVAHDVFLAGRVVAADHRHPAGHEFGEGIAYAAQNPEFRGGEAGVVLGHGHAPGPDVSGDVDLALGHGIGHAVGGVAPDDDPGAGVEPPHIVGAGAEDVDGGVGKAHGAHPLPRRPEDPDQDLLVPCLPDAAANAVLAVGMDLDAAVTRPDRLLDFRLQRAGVHADAVFHAGDDEGGFIKHAGRSYSTWRI